MSTTLLPSAQSSGIVGESPFPFSLLTFPASQNLAKGTSIARRTAGKEAGQGKLVIAGANVSGIENKAHLAALARICAWLPGAFDGTYAVTIFTDHRAPVEAIDGGIGLDARNFGDDARDALAFAWIVALRASRDGNQRAALQQAVAAYKQLSAAEQTGIQSALADGTLDSGHLAAIYLARGGKETDAEEQIRWESWFLGQRRFDLPYDRRAVIEIMDSEAIDPDAKRLLLHDIVKDFDQPTERENIRRVIAEARGANQQIIFGRMSRAFHNQSLLFANAGYIQITEEVSAKLAVLLAACAGNARLAPPADRLRTRLAGVKETAATDALGAVELMEDAILDNLRAEVDGSLRANREAGGKLALNTHDQLSQAEKLLALCTELRTALLSAAQRPAAFVLLSQRIFPLESYLMSRINEAQEPYLGKPENLKMLARRGANRMYSSADYAWLQHADHWVEAIPLFIKEVVLVVDGVEVTETVIDQQAMEETFREQFADVWAKNIDNVMTSEHVALARELLAADDERLAGDDRARAAAVKQYGLHQGVAALAAMIGEGYRAHSEFIHLRVEKDSLSRYDALRAIMNENICNDHPQCLAAVMHRNAKASGSKLIDAAIALVATRGADVQAEAAQLAEIADQPRRAVPALNVLTTQSARMSDGYVRTWLEESMAMGNVIRAHKLDDEVQTRIAGYRKTIGTLGAALIRELGMWAEVEEIMALENLPEPVAVARVIAGNWTIGRQVALRAVLAEYFKLPIEQDAPLVDEMLASKADALQKRALQSVYERNELELLPKMDAFKAANPSATDDDAIKALVLGDPENAEDINAFMRFAAREEAVKAIDAQNPGLLLAAQVRDWLRNHSRLVLTTARRETLLAHDLNHLAMHPLYYYRATGANKRFHQLYTPSRVDLGIHERESVEKWSQWVGGLDREAARVGRRTFGLINKNVKMFNTTVEPEVIKTGENASRVAHFSYSNAMSLMINSMGRGDFEDLADQMSLRKDRLINPGGEGYGGYCVPKDGLFLEFVLILTRATKLRQLAIPDDLHEGIVKLSKHLLSKRVDFQTDFEWEAWAMELLAKRTELKDFFGVRATENGPLPIFQITRIAQALTKLGRPELTDQFDVMSNLAARWGIHKTIVGGEQVNRFMAFFKVWLTYQAIADAKKLNPSVPISDEFITVLSAEYKPNTQDGRFSVGMRKYELFAGTGEHLTYALDTQGQDIVHLMFRGFEDLWQRRADPRMALRLKRVLQDLQIREDDTESINRMRELFPGYAPPAEIRMVSPMMLTTSDLLHYTSDTQLEALAMHVQRRLVNAGLTENEVTANMLVYGPRLKKWTKVRDMAPEQQQTLIKRIGGDIHALALFIIGPAGNYEMSVQGADVVDTGIPNNSLLDILADPVKLREMMLTDNPHSALAIVDGASGARFRAMNRLAVQRWFAAGDAVNRQSMYRCVGLGAETIESWREEMREQRARAKALYQALAAGKATEADSLYANIVQEMREAYEATQLVEAEERMQRQRTTSKEESLQARAIAAISGGLPLGKLDFGAWLALGGMFHVMDLPQAQVADMRKAYEAAIASIGGSVPTADEAMVTTLYCPKYVPAVEEFREEKGIESSNKATEEVAAVAIDTRKRLAERAARARAMSEREQAFKATLAEYEDKGLTAEGLVAEVKAMRGDGSTMGQGQFGKFQALTRLAFTALGKELFSPAQREALALHLDAFFTGREFIPQAIRPIVGGYEDHGDIARFGTILAEGLQEGIITAAQRDAKLATVADLAELFDCCRAIDLTINFFSQDDVDPLMVWRAIADYYAESVNDHFYEYRPWTYYRGIGFAHIKGEDLYQLAVEHYAWLYRYLRTVAVSFTELKALPKADVDNLLGDLDTAAETPAIGADAENVWERRWRAYCQIREIGFVRNDGFPIPQVFAEFDPAIIDAEKRTNMLFLYPVGRTHVSRALMEGPTLNVELQKEGKAGFNLLIGRDVKVADIGAKRQVLQAHNAQLYISKEEYAAALVKHKGMTQADAAKQAEADAGPKGVRIAARFTAPVTVSPVVPFHGHPKYESGLMDQLGLPYSSQSLFHTWTTYDKAKYPAIFCPETGVELPGEMDWLAAWTTELGPAATRKALEHGDPAKNFPGFRAFAKRFPRIMVKDAAESGGRGQKAFVLMKTDGTIDEEALAEAIEFTYAITQKHNVALQEVIITSPEYWATEEFLQSFVDRQVQEWGVAVNRTRRPRTSLYGSQRLIFSTDKPGSGEWHISHMITLNSRQLITNVGRGGTLDILKPEFIRPEYRDRLIARLKESGEKSMNALARYGEVAGAQYVQEEGREIGEDATGVPYSFPRYMMLDFLVQPIFAEEGQLVDLEPVFDESGKRTGSRFILQQADRRVTGHIKDWRVVLIEPNIGIGLWDRLALREIYFNVQATDQPDWSKVGINARVVLRDFASAGADYLKAIKG